MKVPATVYKAGGEAIQVTIRNLSSGGACVALPADRATLRGLVKLELTLPLPGDQPRTCLWRAFVIYQRADGAGLIFDDRQAVERLPLLVLQRALQTTLQTAMQSASAPRQAT